jgi:potassium-transporting ATPase potassium-binding subunit
MTYLDMLQILFYLCVLTLLVKPLGLYMARVFEGKPHTLIYILQPIEKIIYRICGINSDDQMNWKSYLSTMLIFNLLGVLSVYAIQRLQFFLPFNPQHFTVVSPALSFNTAASFVTNTNWQAYSGENSLAYFTQMTALTVQNFLSAATGISLLMALIRGLVRHGTTHLGNFWVDTVRGTIYILLPLAFILSIILVSQGILQNFKPYITENLLQPIEYAQTITNTSGAAVVDINGQPKIENVLLTQQQIPMGPVASQIAIKQLGTNGGGFFGAN